jgi:hypothetical protein
MGTPRHVQLSRDDRIILDRLGQNKPAFPLPYFDEQEAEDRRAALARLRRLGLVGQYTTKSPGGSRPVLTPRGRQALLGEAILW